MNAETSVAQRVSPMHDELEHLKPTWGQLDDMAVPLDFGDRAGEMAAAARLGLADASALARLVVKGAGAQAFLEREQIAIPPEIFQVRPLASGGIIARTGGAEFFLEDGCRGTLVSRLDSMLDSVGSETYRVVRQDASILLAGSRAAEVFLQTCGYDFRKPGDQLVMTRVAGVSCSMLHRTINRVETFQLWMDPSFGAYLWEQLSEIAKELGGRPVGLACFYPELIAAV